MRLPRVPRGRANEQFTRNEAHLERVQEQYKEGCL